MTNKARQSTYSEKLKDPRWQRKRLEIMERDGWMCSKCGDKRNTLNVHHKRYINGKKPWEYDGCDLVTLCELCHKKEHGDQVCKISGKKDQECDSSVEYLIRLWFESKDARMVIQDAMDELLKYKQTIPSVSILESVVNLNIPESEMPDWYRNNPIYQGHKPDPSFDVSESARQSLKRLWAKDVMRRDYAVKTELSKPGIDEKTLMKLIAKSSDIARELRQIDQRFAFDDESKRDERTVNHAE